MTTPEDEMRRMIDDLDLPQPDPDTSVALLGDMELLTRFNKLSRDLMRRGEVLEPKTQAARDIHSTRSAYLIELRRRGIR